MVKSGKRNTPWYRKMMGFFQKPAVVNEVCAKNECDLEKALANLHVANVHYSQATSIIESFIKDFREKQRVNE